uniref:Tyrosine-protein kinase receptor n=1 Tax=Plectus sambesii TaxID=2011161 RepID=A0A914UHZ3_9BILA
MLPSAARLVINVLLLSPVALQSVSAECHFEAPASSLACARLDELLAVDNATAAIVKTLSVVGDQVTQVLLREHFWRFSLLRNVKVTDGVLQSVEWFAFLYNDLLKSVDLSRNRLTEAPWQSFSLVKQSFKLSLNDNALACHCVNYWLIRGSELNKEQTFRAHDGSTYQQSVTHMFHLPAAVSHSPSLAECSWTEPNCGAATLRVSSNRSLLLTKGQEFRLSCHLRNSLELPTITRFPPFEWIKTELTERQPRVRINVSGADFSLTAVADERHLGWVACKSWSTPLPLYDLFDVAIESPIQIHVQSVQFSERSQGVEITVVGYPLTELNMTITRLGDLQVEHFDYNNSLLYGRREEKSEMVALKLVSSPQFFKQLYHIFPLSCGIKHCPTIIYGNFSLAVCNRISCNRNDFSLIPLVYTDVIASPITSSPPSTKSSNLPAWLLVVVSVAALAAFFSGVFYLKWKSARSPKKRYGWELSRSSDEPGIPLQVRNSNYTLREVPYVPRQNLKVMDEIGQGAFGEVFVAEWDCSVDKVAVKVLKQFHAHMQEEFEREAALLAKLLHPHVVRFYGVSRDGDHSLLLIFEYMNLGDLKTYLRKRGPNAHLVAAQGDVRFPPNLTLRELIAIAVQAAEGLSYLTQMHVIHRDIAARNCLVSGAVDDFATGERDRPPIVVKLSDFGMSRDIYSDEYYRISNKRAVLPVRWLPPESLVMGKFTHESDVWSMGITLWEVFSYGQIPYGHMSNSEVLEAATAGSHPCCPVDCPEPIFALMKRCWQRQPSDRISSKELEKLLRQLAAEIEIQR